MGQKTHPIGFRLGVSAEWRSNWFAGKPEGYRELAQEDYRIRQIVAEEYAGEGAISRVDIDRGGGDMSIHVYTSRPGIVIGRNGQRIDRLRHIIERSTGRRVRISADEIKVPELDALAVLSAFGGHSVEHNSCGCPVTRTGGMHQRPTVSKRLYAAV